MHEPIAYIYDADQHCEICAEKKFGHDSEGYIGMNNNGNPCLDSESNEVGIIAPWDDSWADNDRFEGNNKATLVCGTCHNIIEEIDLSE